MQKISADDSAYNIVIWISIRTSVGCSSVLSSESLTPLYSITLLFLWRGGAGNTWDTQAELARREGLAILCVIFFVEGLALLLERLGGTCEPRGRLARRGGLALLFLVEQGRGALANPEVGWRVEVDWPYDCFWDRGGGHLPTQRSAGA